MVITMGNKTIREVMFVFDQYKNRWLYVTQMFASMRICERTKRSGAAHAVLMEEKEENNDTSSILKHTALEAMASILLTYSAAYMPDSETDYLKQYVSSICVFAVIMTMKDSDYFFPDGTPMTTIMLYAATLYTNAAGETKWGDIIGRITGQLLGFALVVYICVENKHYVTTHGMLSSSHRSSALIHAVNEGLGTLIESIAIAYATIPLMTPYEKQDGLKSKSEAFPPENSNLWIVALSLSAIHYTLERIFQASMNPLVTLMHHYLQGSLSDAASPVALQCIGLFLAALYIQWCAPSKETLRKLRKEKTC
jgi:glycerol uptake facilitator-like aquaporin